jgi:hypothetical protein
MTTLTSLPLLNDTYPVDEAQVKEFQAMDTFCCGTSSLKKK